MKTEKPRKSPKKAKRKPGRPSKGATSKGGLTIKDQIFIEKMKNPVVTNTEIAATLGICESTVRGHLSKGLKNRIEAAIAEKFREDIKVLRIKAFKRMHDLLDDDKTPPAVVTSICKFLLDRFVQIEDDRGNEGDVFEFETVISESGTINQIKRVYNAKNISKGSSTGNNDDKREKEAITVNAETSD